MVEVATAPGAQIVVVPEIAAILFPETAPGSPFTVTVVVIVFVQPETSVIAQVMVVVPAATPVTVPEVELIVATAGVLLDQAFVPVVALDNKVVPLTQTVVVPVILDITGNGLTVIAFVTA